MYEFTQLMTKALKTNTYGKTEVCSGLFNPSYWEVEVWRCQEDKSLTGSWVGSGLKRICIIPYVKDGRAFEAGLDPEIV